MTYLRYFECLWLIDPIEVIGKLGEILGFDYPRRLKVPILVLISFL